MHTFGKCHKDLFRGVSPYESAAIFVCQEFGRDNIPPKSSVEYMPILHKFFFSGIIIKNSTLNIILIVSGIRCNVLTFFLGQFPMHIGMYRPISQEIKVPIAHVSPSVPHCLKAALSQ